MSRATTRSTHLLTFICLTCIQVSGVGFGRLFKGS